MQTDLTGLDVLAGQRFLFSSALGQHGLQIDVALSPQLREVLWGQSQPQPVEVVGERLGPMFLQLPPSFGPTQLPQLEAFLNFWPTDMHLAVEVRHSDFYMEQHAQILNTLLSQHKVARVMMDTRPIRTGPTKEQQILQARERKPNLPLQITITTDFTFLRYIGHPRMEVNDPLLDGWAQQIGQWLKQGTTVYVFCHCPFEKHSPEICTTLYQRVSALVPLPPLTLQQEAQDTEIQQPRLF